MQLCGKSGRSWRDGSSDRSFMMDPLSYCRSEMQLCGKSGRSWRDGSSDRSFMEWTH